MNDIKFIPLTVTNRTYQRGNGGVHEIREHGEKDRKEDAGGRGAECDNHTLEGEGEQAEAHRVHLTNGGHDVSVVTDRRKGTVVQV